MLRLVEDEQPRNMRTCQRCGALDDLFTVSTSSGAVGDSSYWNARLCLICARGVLSDVHSGAPYTDPVTVVIGLESL